MPVPRYSSPHELIENSNGTYVRYRTWQRMKRRLDKADREITELRELVETQGLMLLALSEELQNQGDL